MRIVHAHYSCAAGSSVCLCLHSCTSLSRNGDRGSRAREMQTQVWSSSVALREAVQGTPGVHRQTLESGICHRPQIPWAQARLLGGCQNGWAGASVSAVLGLCACASVCRGLWAVCRGHGGPGGCKGPTQAPQAVQHAVQNCRKALLAQRLRLCMHSGQMIKSSKVFSPCKAVATGCKAETKGRAASMTLRSGLHHATGRCAG